MLTFSSIGKHKRKSKQNEKRAKIIYKMLAYLPNFTYLCRVISNLFIHL